MARDRQRAKQRKARRAQSAGPARSQPRRTDVPGELEHASGEVDEFEAALVSGADGKTVDDEPDVRDEVEAGEAEADEPSALSRADRDDFDDEPSALSRADRDDFDDEPSALLEDEDHDFDDATLEREAAAAAPRREAAVPGAPTRKGAGRFVGFLRASWAELQRVQWPDRRQVAQATGVVIGFVIVAGLYLGLADWVAKQVVNFII
ncbi:MAG TPA: preprotein translocase subunit SecE [Solirubrobacteraceae bacterium]